MVIVGLSKSTKPGKQVRLRFQFTQHFRDELLLKNFIEFFGCGNYYLRLDQKAGDFLVTNFSDIDGKNLVF